MAIKLTPEQQQALSGRGSIEAEDDTGSPYVIVPQNAFLHLQSQAHELDDASRQQLSKLVQAGIDSGDYLPHDEVFEDLKAQARQLDSRSSQ